MLYTRERELGRAGDRCTAVSRSLRHLGQAASVDDEPESCPEQEFNEASYEAAWLTDG